MKISVANSLDSVEKGRKEIFLTKSYAQPFSTPVGKGRQLSGFTVMQNTGAEFVEKALIPFLDSLYNEFGEKHAACQQGTKFLEILQNMRSK